MLDLSKMTTETRNPNTMNLDAMTPLEIMTAMNNEDAKVHTAIGKVLPQIAQAAQWAGEVFTNGGRLIYMGAGTSGRLGVLDASECPPTFGVSHNTVVGLIAGGEIALRNAVEGAEDNALLGRQDLIDHNLTDKDVVIGIAASGRTPYVLGGMAYAKRVGCKVAVVVCNNSSEMANVADLAIEIIVGPEVLTGSTRLKAGTAQKLVLNMISTAAMVCIGKVYLNLMVDVQPTNEKLRVRARDIVMQAAKTDGQTAAKALRESDYNVKTAIVMILCHCDSKTAQKKLQGSNGHVRGALKE